MCSNKMLRKFQCPSAAAYIQKPDKLAVFNKLEGQRVDVLSERQKHLQTQEPSAIS